MGAPDDKPRPLAGQPERAKSYDERAAPRAGLVSRARSTSHYGQPRDLFERVAARWSQVLGVRVTGRQVAVCLIDVKVARLTHDPRHLDSITDIAGYAAILAELAPDA